MQVIGALVREQRVSDHEVVECRCVVPEVDPVQIARLHERDEGPDTVLVRVEVLDVEPVAAEARARVGDRAQVVEVVAVARVRDHHAPRIDPFPYERVESDETCLRRRVRVHHHRGVGLDGGGGDEREDARDVPYEPVAVDRALEERGPDAGVPDALAELVHEQIDDPVVGPVPEKAR